MTFNTMHYKDHDEDQNEAKYKDPRIVENRFGQFEIKLESCWATFSTIRDAEEALRLVAGESSRKANEVRHNIREALGL